MVPALWPGESVSVAPASIDEIEAGRIVVFARNHQFVVHRVVRRSACAADPFLVTRGDAVADHDLPVGPGELLGVVTAIHHRERKRPVPRRPAPMGRAVAVLVRRSRVLHAALRHFSSLIAYRATATAPARSRP
jgi:hypothetical protein